MSLSDSFRTLKMRDCVILGGTSHPDLVARICRMLDIEPVPLMSTQFSNGETSIVIKESVRDKDVFVVQTSHGGVNNFLMELLIVISACKSASAKSITAVLPLFPYSRQLDAQSLQSRMQAARHPSVDSTSSSSSVAGGGGPGGGFGPASTLGATNSPRKASTFGEETRVAKEDLFSGGPAGGLSSVSSPAVPQISFDAMPSLPGGAKRAPQLVFEPVLPREAEQMLNGDGNNGMRNWVAQSGSLVANLLTSAGADHIITMDLHDPQYQGFFDVPFDNLLFRPLLIEYIKHRIPTYHSAVIVSPDAGGAKRATTVADQLHMRFALIHQDRRNNATILVGDVSDRVAIIIDDLTDSGKTLMRAAKIVKDHGAVRVVGICTHGLFSADTVYRIQRSPIDMVVTTNSVPQDAHQAVLGDRLQVVDISNLFAEAIRRVYNGESISRLYHTAAVEDL